MGGTIAWYSTTDVLGFQTTGAALASRRCNMVDTSKDGWPLLPPEEDVCRWLEENVDAFAAQARWHDQHVHPLADIIMGPARDLLLGV